MSDEECHSLPAKVTITGGHPAIESVWELSDEEIKLIVNSKRIRLGILGQGMPPVYMSVEPETQNKNHGSKNESSTGS